MKEKINKIGDFLYKYRYIIAIVVLILCVILELNGSSIGSWNSIIDSGLSDEKDTIFGTPRNIRSDEWAVTTAVTFSQKFNNFKYFSDLVRGNPTEMFIAYNAPVRSWIQIFKPFQIGYLFLGLAKGLSLFWCGKIIALFLISFEFFMILTKKNKWLSFLGSIILTLSPQLQWWFATDFFIYGQLAIILLYLYMNTESLKKRICYLLGMIICAGGYILILYPAYQIPIFYVFFGLAIWIIINNRKNCKITWKDITSIIIAFLIFAGSMSYIFIQSSEAIVAISETAYPGARIEIGGGAKNKYLSYIQNIFFAYRDQNLATNVCEEAVMFGLFPMGFIISCMAMIKNKKADLPTIILFVAYAFLGIYCFYSFSETLAKLTLMSYSRADRAVMALGYIDILLLLRGLTIIEKSPKIWISLLISAIVSICLVTICNNYNDKYVTTNKFFILLAMCLWLFYFVLRYKTKLGKVLFSVGIIFVMLFTGIKINPLRKGIDIIYDSPIIKQIQEINNSEYGLWISEDIGFPLPNYILMAGVPVLNSTNVYPNMEKWKLLDPEGNYEIYYNRYAHIQMKLRKKEEITQKFELFQPDWFIVYVTPEDLKELNVKYLVTARFLDEYNTETVNFELITVCQGLVFYKINY